MPRQVDLYLRRGRRGGVERERVVRGQCLALEGAGQRGREHAVDPAGIIDQRPELLWANPRHSSFEALVLPFEEVEELLSIRVQRLSIPSSRASGDCTVHCQHQPL